MSKKLLKGKTIVVGVTASIAAYKTLKIIKKLKRLGADIHIIMTKHAMDLVDPADFEKASNNPVSTNLFIADFNYRRYLAENKEINHISLSDIADVFLVCPATANILAKAANGIADDLLTTTILSTQTIIVFAPAMNVKMWRNKITQENVYSLKKRGFLIIEPEYGDLACGYKGVGRLADSEKIISAVSSILKINKQLCGKKIIVTAGATVEQLDGVRILTNPASGKMGRALAENAFLRGASVVLIRAANSVEPRFLLKERIFQTRDELIKILKKETIDADIVIHTAAITDFYHKKVQKMKKKSNCLWNLTLYPTSKIIDRLKKFNKKAFIVGFKAEYKISKNDLIRLAYETLNRSGIDLMVANDVGKKERGFAVDTNEVYLVDREKKVIHLPLAGKKNIAEEIWSIILEKLRED